MYNTVGSECVWVCGVSPAGGQSAGGGAGGTSSGSAAAAAAAGAAAAAAAGGVDTPADYRHQSLKVWSSESLRSLSIAIPKRKNT